MNDFLDRDTLVLLVRKAQSGDRHAFGVLADRFAGCVRKAVRRRLSDPDDVDELCQDVLVVAMRKVNQLREPERFGAWLRQIAGRLSLNRAQRHKPALAGEAAMESACSPETGPDEAAERAEAFAVLHQGLNRLRVEDRETLLEHYKDGRSVEEIATRLNKPAGTIKRRLFDARNRLRDVLVCA